jgi:hypothetical protein
MVEESNIKQSSLDFSDIDLARQLFGEQPMLPSMPEVTPFLLQGTKFPATSLRIS